MRVFFEVDNVPMWNKFSYFPYPNKLGQIREPDVNIIYLDSQHC